MSKYFYKDDKYYPIPEAPLYICSNDSFASETLKRASEGFTKDVCIVPCFSGEEAQAVEDYVRSRKDQKYIRLNLEPPRGSSGVRFSLLLGWQSQAMAYTDKGNREVIVSEHYKRARMLSDEELEALAAVPGQARHSCESCYFCIAKMELSWRRDEE